MIGSDDTDVTSLEFSYGKIVVIVGVVVVVGRMTMYHVAHM